MTQYTLLGKTYEIPKTSADFLDSYIKRLKTYISDNHISDSYLDDILERVGDKLTQLETESSPIKNADIIKIVNDIGEAEDIFPKEEIKSESKNPTQNTFQKSLKRDTENAMLFGVCAGIARHLGVEALWIRILFIVFTFTGGAGIIIYIFLIFLIPSDKKHEKKLPKESDRGIIDHLSSMVGSSFRGVFRLFLIIIFGAIGFAMIGIFIAGVTISGILLGGSFEIGNQQFLTNLSDALRIAIPLLTTMSLVIVVAIFANIIGRDLFGRRGWLVVSIVTAIGCILLATGSFQMVREYTWMEENNTSQEFAFSGKSLDIDNKLSHSNEGNQIMHSGFDTVTIQRNSTIKNIKIEARETFYTKDKKTATEIVSAKNPITYTLSGNTLTLSKVENQDFKTPVPFSFFHRDIKITIPDTIELKNTKGRYEYIEDRNHKNIPDAPEFIEEPTMP